METTMDRMLQQAQQVEQERERKKSASGLVANLKKLVAQAQRAAGDKYAAQVIVGDTPSGFVASRIAYEDPSLVLFIGSDAEGNEMLVAQHTYRVNVSIAIVPKEGNPHRLGYWDCAYPNDAQSPPPSPQ